MPTTPSYQLEIAPLISLPLTRSALFSYHSREDIALGSIVKIPFGKQSVEGVVFASRPMKIRAPQWMKMPEKTLLSQALTSEQRKLALKLSENTYTPLGIVLKHFVVLPSKKEILTQEKNTPPKNHLPTISLSQKENVFLKKLLKISPKKPALWKNNPNEHQKILISLLNTLLEKNEQVLILVPEVLLAEWWYASLSHFYEKTNLTLLHSRLTQSIFRKNWSDIRNGKTHLIIGTRQALFAPFKKLGLILQFDAEDEVSYSQWEMSPRYQTYEVAQWLSHIHLARLFFVTPTPSLTLEQITPDHYSINPNQPPKSEHLLVNLRMLYKPGRDLTLTPDLLSVMEITLKKKERVFLIARQQGLASFSLCLQCKQVFRCPNCYRALTPKSSGHFTCARCHFQTPTFPTCPTCGGLQFKNIGSGTEKVESLTRRYFPKHTLLRLDTLATKRYADLVKILHQIQSGNFDILIGTIHHTLLPNLPETSLIAMIEADTSLSFPDYRSEEKLSQSLIRASCLVQNVPHGKVFLQTFSPEQTLFEEFSAHSFSDTKKRLLEERALLAYPPYGRFVRLECTGKTLKEAASKRNHIIQKLTHLNLPFEVKPLELAKKTDSKRAIILLRFPQKNNFPTTLHHFFLRHSKDFIVDIDPLHLT